jgi:hypothetical protein
MQPTTMVMVNSHVLFTFKRDEWLSGVALIREEDLERKHKGIAKEIGRIKREQKRLQKMFWLGFLWGSLFNIVISLLLYLVVKTFGL